MGVGEAEHHCEWRERAEALEREVSSLKEAVAKLQHDSESTIRRLLGPKSERVTPVEKELRGDEPVDYDEIVKKRRERQKEKAKLETVTTVIPVAEKDRHCPKCGNSKLSPLGGGKVSTVYDYIPGRFIARRQVRETLRCACGEGIVTAEAPPQWQEKSRYSARYVAHLITAKCADSIPFYRLEKEADRIGMPISRSTMTDLFHLSAEALAPLADRLLDLIRQAFVVHADETSLRVMAEGNCRNGFIWAFRTRLPKPLIGYRFSPTRSGETPNQVLGGTEGTLVVDGYTGYNHVTDVGGRRRAACYAHVRRYFFDAQPTAPEAREALDFIRELYRVEAEALEAGVVGGPGHLALRKEKSLKIRNDFRAWLDAKQAEHPPKGPLGVAIRYTLNQWDELGLFLTDVRIPLDNNAAESALRRVALGRKNFLFVGHDEAGNNLAGLYSLVATCEANGVNPVDYLTDVLLRITTHPNSRIDDLLPHRWTGPPACVPPDSTQENSPALR